LLSGGWDRTLRLWDVASMKEVRKLEGHTMPIDSVAFSPDGRTLASGSELEKVVRLWDAASGAEMHRLDAPSDGVWTVAGEPVLVLQTFWQPITGYVLTADRERQVELVGRHSDTPRTRPVCRAGALSFPFDLCRERCEAHGLIAKALR
jgi:WD40 repeat protein